jgi:hypothetical protein
MFTSESTLNTSAVFIEPDRWLWEPDWKLYFYQWLKSKSGIKVIPKWTWTNEYIREHLLKLPKNELEKQYSYNKIWEQAAGFCHPAGFDNEIIERIKEGNPVRFKIENKRVESWYDPEIQSDNLPGVRAKYYFISLCPVCRKSVNITLSKPKRLCPNCERLTSNQRLQLRRAIKKGRRICKYCGMVVLPKEYPNRDYCSRNHQQKADRRRKEHERWIKEDEKFVKNGGVVG